MFCTFLEFTFDGCRCAPLRIASRILLMLMTKAAPQRDHSLREVFNALRYVIRHGIAWRATPNDFPPSAAVYQQSQRWLASGCFETLAQGLQAVLRLAGGRCRRPDRG